MGGGGGACAPADGGNSHATSMSASGNTTVLRRVAVGVRRAPHSRYGGWGMRLAGDREIPPLLCTYDAMTTYRLRRAGVGTPERRQRLDRVRKARANKSRCHVPGALGRLCGWGRHELPHEVVDRDEKRNEDTEDLFGVFIRLVLQTSQATHQWLPPVAHSRAEGAERTGPSAYDRWSRAMRSLRGAMATRS
jgi:hypothetical protein